MTDRTDTTDSQRRVCKATARHYTRGVVLYPFDLSLSDWPERANRAGLNTIALHTARDIAVLIDFVRSDEGRKFLDDCARLGVEVEYELHAMANLLSRELFFQEPLLFRQNKSGARSDDYNCCPSSDAALEIIAGKALEFARILTPTTGRYFYWSDDGREWCFCERCRDYSASEQALIVENRILQELRQLDPKACLSHLAYGPTIEPPRQVTPDVGIFLEYAPIKRTYDRPYIEQTDPGQQDRLEWLDANLQIFGAIDAQVLEYWLDVSRFSSWKRPAKKLPWRRDVFLADLETYARRGIRHITSFACFIDADYVRMYGDLDFLDEYGGKLRATERNI